MEVNDNDSVRLEQDDDGNPVFPIKGSPSQQFVAEAKQFLNDVVASPYASHTDRLAARRALDRMSKMTTTHRTFRGTDQPILIISRKDDGSLWTSREQYNQIFSASADLSEDSEATGVNSGLLQYVDLQRDQSALLTARIAAAESIVAHAAGPADDAPQFVVMTPEDQALL